MQMNMYFNSVEGFLKLVIRTYEVLLRLEATVRVRVYYLDFFVFFVFNLVPRAFPLKVGGAGKGKSPGNEVALSYVTGEPFAASSYA